MVFPKVLSGNGFCCPHADIVQELNVTLCPLVPAA
jgi:hypothetical protein